VTSWHLRHLAGFGLVVDADPGEVPGDRRQRWWKAIARGFTFETGSDPDSRLLAGQLVAVAQEQVTRWITETEPVLEPEWLRAGGISNTRVCVTAAELEELAEQINELLAPYARRTDADTPPEAREVRILRHYLPEAPA
jgi:hypothetical protein